MRTPEVPPTTPLLASRPRARVLAVMAVIAVVTAGCSSSSEPKVPTATTDEAGSPSSTGPTSTSADPTTTAATGPLDPNGVPIADHPDACALLTAADAAAAFGMPFGAAEPSITRIGDVELPRPGDCSYSADGGRFRATVRVHTVSRDAQQARRLFETGKTIFVPNLVVVPGIGDEAYDPGRRTPTVEVLKGKVTFGVEALPEDAAGPGRARALAAVVAGRL